QKLTGPDAGSTTLSWDDSLLLPRQGDDWPPALLAAENVDSTGGVRGWGRPMSGLVYGWGDNRLMDTWTRAEVVVTSTGEIPPRSAAPTVTKTADVTEVAVGESVRYRVTVTNDGTAAVTAAAPWVLTDVLDPALGLAGQL